MFKHKKTVLTDVFCNDQILRQLEDFSREKDSQNHYCSGCNQREQDLFILYGYDQDIHQCCYAQNNPLHVFHI